jgi:hypothetical protein
MTEREFASALVPLAAGFDKKLEAETIRAYYDRLREFDIDVFQQSVAAALDSGQWFPRVAELRSREVGTPARPRSLLRPNAGRSPGGRL